MGCQYLHQVRHLFQKVGHEDIGILGRATTGGALLGACEDSSSRNSTPDHPKMVLVNPRLHPVLWAPVPTLPRVPVPEPRIGQNSLSGACASSISSSVSLMA